MKHLAFTIFFFLSNLSVFYAKEISLQTWSNEQKMRSLFRLRDAIDSKDGAPGSVFASPSKSHPDYYYHWVRDASIVFREIYEIRMSEPEMTDRLLGEFADFSRKNQLSENLSGGPLGLGLGEPKFHLDGSAFLGAWGRPQNDGPALRAFLMAQFAQDLWKRKKYSALNQIYRRELPANTILKADLEYIAHHWQDPSFDLWEEVFGDHFYTRMTQWKALKQGAQVARLLDDDEAAIFYDQQAEHILASLYEFWSPQKQILKATINTKATDYNKFSDIDVAIILAVNQVGSATGAYSQSDPRMIKTALAIENAFAYLYPINALHQNKNQKEMAPAIGRYPEDQYDGYQSDKMGNPWILTTLALAEFYYNLSRHLAYNPEISSFSFNKGDGFLRRIQFHTDENGHFSEQINRDNGKMQGARDLTWSYAAFLSCMRARNKAISHR